MFFRASFKDASDAALVRLAAKGDEAAFSCLLARYQDSVYKFVVYFLGDAEEAKDITQETFLRLYRTAATYRPEASLKAFLLRIARNLCVDAMRKQRASSSPHPPEGEDHDIPERVLARSDSMEALVRALRGLPEKQRAAVLLRHLDGMKYDEIAQALNTTVPAVESLLARGRKRLREELGEHMS